MELDELKNTWLALDKKLDENNSLNDRIIKEMLYEKGNKSLGRLLGYEIFGLIILIGVIPFIVYSTGFHPNLTGYSLFMQSMVVVVILLLVWQSLKIYSLAKMNLTKPIKDNIRHINRYNIYIKREKQGSILLAPLLGGLCTFFYAKLNVDITIWIFATCLFVALLVYSIWAYKRIFDKNISSIRNSLDELKDLEEE